jgi:4-aminobutyrate aminotransferase/(S)-3-amino-2-methylpropionate transaminase
MVGFDVLAPDGVQFDGAAAKAVCQRAAEKGLIVLSCGALGQTIRILVPLTAPNEIVEEGLDLLEAALSVAP